jgi:hypothetical protein
MRGRIASFLQITLIFPNVPDSTALSAGTRPTHSPGLNLRLPKGDKWHIKSDPGSVWWLHNRNRGTLVPFGQTKLKKPLGCIVENTEIC